MSSNLRIYYFYNNLITLYSPLHCVVQFRKCFFFYTEANIQVLITCFSIKINTDFTQGCTLYTLHFALKVSSVD